MVEVYNLDGKLVKTIDGGSDTGTALLYPIKVAFREQNKEVLIMGKKVHVPVPGLTCYSYPLSYLLR